MKSVRRFGINVLTIILSVLLPASVMAADLGMDFFGPKMTTQYNNGGQIRPIMLPGDPAIYPISGSDPLDLALPMRRVLSDLENLGAAAWNTIGPDTFFNSDTVSAPGLNVQALKAFLDNDAEEDVVVLSYDNGSVGVCYNFTMGNCAGAPGVNAELPIFSDQPNGVGTISPITGIVGDYNGDGRDDVVLIAQDVVTKQGFIVRLYNNGSGGANPFDIFTDKVEGSYSTSVAAGDFNNDGREDLVVAGADLMAWKQGRISVLVNTGNPAPNDFEQIIAEEPIMSDCNFPTGLESFDNGNGLVMTCAFMVDAANVLRGGPVKILQRDPANVRQFTTKQVITNVGEPGLSVPTRSAICDFNGDGKRDIATAIWGTTEIQVYPGVDDFSVDADNREVINTAPYPIAYIECPDIDADGTQDLLGVSRSDLQNSVYNYTAGDEATEGFTTRLYVTQDTTVSAQGQTLVVTEQTLNAASGDATPMPPAVQQIQTSDNSAQITVDLARTISLPAVPALVVNQLPRYNGDYRELQVAEVRAGDAVIVYLSERPGVTIDEPDCNSTEISYQCFPKDGGVDVTSCVATSAEIAIAGTPAAAANNWQGTVTLPAEPDQFSITVTADYTDGTQYQTVLNVDRSICPSGSGSGCPEVPIEKHVFDQEYFSLCVSDVYSKNATLEGSTIQWHQVGGPEFLGLVKGSEYEYKNIEVGGPCIEGAFLSQNWFTTKGYDLEYRTVAAGGEAGPWCPAKLIQTTPGVEGSGTCALNSNLRVTPLTLAIGLGFGVLPLLWSMSRRRQRAERLLVRK